jgi:exonuclease VII small subunit
MTGSTSGSADRAMRTKVERVERVDRELDDALYYLREGCKPCAQRHLDLARRFGATEEQIAAVARAGSNLP